MDNKKAMNDHIKLIDQINTLTTLTAALLVATLFNLLILFVNWGNIKNICGV